jgi:hypothetical protein
LAPGSEELIAFPKHLVRPRGCGGRLDGGLHKEGAQPRRRGRGERVAQRHGAPPLQGRIAIAVQEDLGVPALGQTARSRPHKGWGCGPFAAATTRRGDATEAGWLTAGPSCRRGACAAVCVCGGGRCNKGEAGERMRTKMVGGVFSHVEDRPVGDSIEAHGEPRGAQGATHQPALRNARLLPTRSAGKQGRGRWHAAPQTGGGERKWRAWE